MTIDAQYQWQMPAPIPFEVIESLGGYSRIHQRLLFNRGITDPLTASAFLHEQGSRYNPFLLKGMEKACELILDAVDHSDLIVIYGDYDVDGVTASAIMVQALEKLGATVRGYIPNRFEEGYGVNAEAVKTLHSEGIKLCITVDCGIRSTEETVLAQQLGMKMIIADHHEPGDVLPNAEAVINPKQQGDKYPDKQLAGVGLAYKMAEALFALRPMPPVRAEDWLDLASIGSVADMVPLEDENRSIVRSGLEKLRISDRPAIRALADVSKVMLADIDAGTIGFSFGPRLNAAGRLESAKKSFQLLMAKTDAEARQLAAELNEQNTCRRAIMEEIQAQVMRHIDPLATPIVIAAADQSYSVGVVGLAASKLTEQFYRPSLVGQREEGMIRASCRSIPEFNIHDGLTKCSDLLVKYGGHAMAAGLTVKEENWEPLIARLRAVADEMLAGKTLQPTRVVEMELTADYIRPDTVRQIEEMAPFGQGNPEPIVLIRNVNVIRSITMGKERNHFKLILGMENHQEWEAIMFRQAERRPEQGERLDVIGYLSINRYMGQEKTQLRLVDFRSAEG